MLASHTSKQGKLETINSHAAEKPHKTKLFFKMPNRLLQGQSVGAAPLGTIVSFYLFFSHRSGTTSTHHLPSLMSSRRWSKHFCGSEIKNRSTPLVPPSHADSYSCWFLTRATPGQNETLFRRETAMAPPPLFPCRVAIPGGV